MPWQRAGVWWACVSAVFVADTGVCGVILGEMRIIGGFAKPSLRSRVTLSPAAVNTYRVR